MALFLIVFCHLFFGDFFLGSYNKMRKSAHKIGLIHEASCVIMKINSAGRLLKTF